jgi:hypothetical protein
MRQIAPRAGALVAVLLLLAGCATPVVQTLDYACEGGRGFRLKIADDVTDIVFDDMRFNLQAEAPNGNGGLVHSCSMLRLTRRGDAAQVEMEGRPFLANCRRTH